jgi:hypothetical protein
MDSLLEVRVFRMKVFRPSSGSNRQVVTDVHTRGMRTSFRPSAYEFNRPALRVAPSAAVLATHGGRFRHRGDTPTLGRALRNTF